MIKARTIVGIGTSAETALTDATCKLNEFVNASNIEKQDLLGSTVQYAMEDTHIETVITILYWSAS